jgi:DNA-binding CsgD family transcriptional regulator
MSSPSSVFTRAISSHSLTTQKAIDSDLGLILMDMSFKTIGFDRGAVAILSEPGPSGPSHPGICSIPPEIRKVISESRPTDLERVKLGFRRGAREYECRVSIVECHDGSLPSELVILQFERTCSPGDSLNKLSAEYQLTSREQEVLRGIAMGLTSKELADRMMISPGTVKSFIRMIMAKLAVKTRGAILARLLEYNGK